MLSRCTTTSIAVIHIEEMVSFDHFQPFIHQIGRINCNLGPIIQVGCLRVIATGHITQLLR